MRAGKVAGDAQKGAAFSEALRMRDSRSETVAVWGVVLLIAVLGAAYTIHDMPAERARRVDAADRALKALPPVTFHGYVCAEYTCAGHERGYDWAQSKGIEDPDNCPYMPNGSRAFTEGCWAEAGRPGPLPDESGRDGNP